MPQTCYPALPLRHSTGTHKTPRLLRCRGRRRLGRLDAGWRAWPDRSYECQQTNFSNVNSLTFRKPNNDLNLNHIYIYIYIFHNFRNIPEICPESTSIYHQRCNMTNPRSYDYLQKRNKFYTNSIMGPTVGPWQTHLPPRHGAPGAMPPAGSEAICIITSRGMHPFHPFSNAKMTVLAGNFLQKDQSFQRYLKNCLSWTFKAKSMEVPSLICLQLHTCQEKI